MLKTLLAGMSIRAGIRAIRFYRPTVQPYHPIRVTGLGKSQAEDLLDWLEANGCRDFHLSFIAGEGFTVLYSKSR